MNQQIELPLSDDSPTVGDKLSATSQIIKLCQEMDERREHVENALAHARGTHNYDDIVMMVMSNRLKWWCLPNSFMVTEVYTFPQKSLLGIFLAGGNLEEILDTQDDLIAHAKMCNCQGIVMTGRLGWKKPLMAQGWGHMSMGIELEVPHDG